MGVLLGLGLPGGVAGAAPAARSAGSGWEAVVSQKDLGVWQKEGSGDGWLGHYKPRHPPGYYGIGTTATPAEISGWDIAIPPTGEGLPAGQGSVGEGETLFASHCAACHGTFGEGNGGFPALVGGVGSLGSSSPQKTPGSYWPYATTLWDYINRAMPFTAPHTLKPGEVYALVAWILNMNGIVKENWIADQTTLPQVKMPAVAHWNWQDPRPVTHASRCMTDCKDPKDVSITSNAANSKLTPRLTGPLDRMTKQ